MAKKTVFFFFLFLYPFWALIKTPSLAQSNEEVVCFGHIGDTHIDDSPSNLYSSKKVLEFFNQVIKPAFVVHTGDLVTNPSQSVYNKYQQTINLLYLNFPVKAVPGNHDYAGNFQAFLSLIGPNNFSFDYQGYHFVGLDSLRIDFTWLENELKNFPGKTVIFSHLPVEWPLNLTHHSINMSEPDRKKIGGLIEKYQVLAYLSGHIHRPFIFYNPEHKVLNIGVGATLTGYSRLVCLDEGKVSTLSLSVSQAPLVIITSPQDYLDTGERGKVNGLVKVRAKTFTDQASISSVQYQIDSGAWASLNLISGNLWEASWDTSQVSFGQHTLTAKITNSSSKTFEHKIKVLTTASGTIPSPTSSASLPGDVNHDGHVNMADFGIFVSKYGTNDPGCNFNKTGGVDMGDYAILVENYGR